MSKDLLTAIEHYLAVERDVELEEGAVEARRELSAARADLIREVNLQEARPAMKLGRILAAVDHDRHPAVATAVSLAGTVGATLGLVNVVTWPAGAGDVNSGYVPELAREKAFREARVMLEGCQEKIPAGIASEVLVREGDSATEIVQAARDWGADLIVMGTHHRGWVKRFFLGSTSAGVIPKATCPVLLVSDVKRDEGDIDEARRLERNIG